MDRVIRRLVIAALIVGLVACGGPGRDRAAEAVEPDLSQIYVDLIERACLAAGCGSGPLFVTAPHLDEPVRAAIEAEFPEAVLVSSSYGLIDANDQVRDGGRILDLQSPSSQSAGLVTVDIYWTRSRFEGKGETYAYLWDPDAGQWRNVPPSEVGITVTTAVP
jgi:hypothetical protein